MSVSLSVSEKAVIVKSFGSYDCLSVESFPLPSLEDNVEVEVHVAGLNFADLYTRQGLMKHHALPFVLGMECVGVVTGVGSAENCPLKVGQRVICYDYNCGMYRTTLRINPKKCFPIPDDVSFNDAAALFVNYLTAYFALFDLGNLRKNEVVLIQSCGGGVGCAATQLAKTVEGVVVLGTVSCSKAELVKQNGVDHVLSYDNIQKQVKDIYPAGVDLVIDNQAGKAFNIHQNLLRQLGRIVITGANSMIGNDKRLSTFTLLKAWWNMKSISPLSLITNNRSVCGLHLGLLAEQELEKTTSALRVIFNLLEEGKISPKIDSVWPIEQIVDATKVLAERRNVGKVLLQIKEAKNDK